MFQSKEKCSKCVQKKSLSEFGKRGNGLEGQCKDCINTQNRKWRRENREKVKSWPSSKKKYGYPPRKKSKEKRLKERYGITLEQYDEMFENQDGVCAICDGVSINGRLVIDHNHETGEVRGLLCYRCNTLVGFLEKNFELITKAVNWFHK